MQAYQYIFHAKYPERIVRMKLDEDIANVSKSYITEEGHLFLFTEVKDVQAYRIIRINLKKYPMNKNSDAKYFKQKKIV
jgi:hypothetical protein